MAENTNTPDTTTPAGVSSLAPEALPASLRGRLQAVQKRLDAAIESGDTGAIRTAITDIRTLLPNPANSPVNSEQPGATFDESDSELVITNAKAIRDQLNNALTAKDPMQAKALLSQLKMMVGMISQNSRRYGEMAQVVSAASGADAEIQSLAIEAASGGASVVATAQSLVVSAMSSPGVQNFFRDQLGGTSYDSVNVNVARPVDNSPVVTVNQQGQLSGDSVRESFSDIGFYTLSREKQQEIRAQLGLEEDRLPLAERMNRINARGARLHRSLTEMQQYNAGVIEKSSLSRTEKDAKLAENDKYFKEAHLGVDEISKLERNVATNPNDEMAKALLQAKQEEFGTNLKRNIVERVLMELNMVQRMISGGFGAEISGITSGLVNAVTGGNRNNMSPNA
jgi:hypothetical protein